ncbi:MAG: NAD(P)-binding domain-containing protein, partial [Rhizobiales bacterium]|nr:NAD(P)-binding domain-containing protein [Hyphomicrobiales bacterium]
MEIKNIGVIGAGQMGNGIAHVCALAGYSVKLNDVSRERVEAALATINGNLSRQVASEKISEADRESALGLISGETDFQDLVSCDLIIESV